MAKGSNLNNYDGRGENPTAGLCGLDRKSGIDLCRFSGGLSCSEVAVTPPAPKDLHKVQACSAGLPGAKYLCS